MEEINQLKNAEEFLELPNSWEERGIEKGIEKGKFEEKINIAHAMLRKGLSVNLITEVTGLDEEKIEKLRKTL